MPLTQTLTLASRAAAIMAAALVVAGCSTAPAATPAPVESTEPASIESTPTPTAEPMAEAALIIIGALSLTVADADGNSLLELTYASDADAAVEQLSQTLGESPTALLEPASSCIDETVITRWGGLRLDDPAGVAAGPGAAFTVGADAPTTASGVPIISSVGFAVGDPISDVNLLAAARTVVNGGWTDMYADLQGASFDDPDAWGVRGTTFSTVVERFGAPFHYYYDC
jgi:hypothetical protein